MIFTKTNATSKKLALFSLLASASIASLYALAAKNDPFTDFVNHARFSEVFAATGLAPSHPLFQLLVILVSSLTSLHMVHSGLIVTWLTVCATFLLCFQYLAKSSNIHAFWIAFLVCALMFFHSITVFFPVDHHLYFGYVTSTVFHNPTILLLKPIALIHFLFCSSLITNPTVRQKEFFLLFFLTLVSALAKPSYLFTLVPTFGVFLLLYKKPFKHLFPLYLVSVAIPTFLIFTWQAKKLFVASHLTGLETSGFSLATLDEFRFYQIPIWTLLPRLIASLFFPASVVLTNLDWVKTNKTIQLALLNLILSLGVNYFIAESGNRFSHGNFWWSAQVALFLVNVICVKKVVDNLARISLSNWSLRNSLPICLLVLHFFSGLIWFLSNLIPGRFFP